MAKWLGIAIILLQLIDIALHAATDQIEPLRVASNVVILVWLVSLLLGGQFARSKTLAYGVVALYAFLNLIFLALHGLTNPQQDDAPRIVLFVIVGLTIGSSVRLQKGLVALKQESI